jgi:hypothetical protein
VVVVPLGVVLVPVDVVLLVLDGVVVVVVPVGRSAQWSSLTPPWFPCSSHSVPWSGWGSSLQGLPVLPWSHPSSSSWWGEVLVGVGLPVAPAGAAVLRAKMAMSRARTAMRATAVSAALGDGWVERGGAGMRLARVDGVRCFMVGLLCSGVGGACMHTIGGSGDYAHVLRRTPQRVGM